VLNDAGTVDAGKLRAVSRLGGPTYARVGQGFDLRAPPAGSIREVVRVLKEKAVHVKR
jgi:hypothetical protein